MSRIFDIAHRYVDEIAALDPNLATDIGVPGHEREMTDYSPDGTAAIAAFNRRSVEELEETPIEDDARGGSGRADRLARSVMLERLGVHLDLFEAGEHFQDLNNIASPLQNIRQVFDQMPRSTEEEWSNIAARLQLVPDALVGYRRTLSDGVQRGTPAARRQGRSEALGETCGCLPLPRSLRGECCSSQQAWSPLRMTGSDSRTRESLLRFSREVISAFR